MGCNCGKIRHEYTQEYLDKKIREKLQKEKEKKEIDNNGKKVEK